MQKTSRVGMKYLANENRGDNVVVWCSRLTDALVGSADDKVF